MTAEGGPAAQQLFVSFTEGLTRRQRREASLPEVWVAVARTAVCSRGSGQWGFGGGERKVWMV